MLIILISSNCTLHLIVNNSLNVKISEFSVNSTKNCSSHLQLKFNGRDETHSSLSSNFRRSSSSSCGEIWNEKRIRLESAESPTNLFDVVLKLIQLRASIVENSMLSLKETVRRERNDILSRFFFTFVRSKFGSSRFLSSSRRSWRKVVTFSSRRSISSKRAKSWKRKRIASSFSVETRKIFRKRRRKTKSSCKEVFSRLKRRKIFCFGVKIVRKSFVRSTWSFSGCGEIRISFWICSISFWRIFLVFSSEIL